MSRCYHCGKILKDAWIIKEGARLMGKKLTGAGKARTSEQARKAARARWDKWDEAKEKAQEKALSKALKAASKRSKKKT
jgi:hypothetical protein